MATGYFPIDSKFEGKGLVEIIQKLNETRTEYYYAISENCVPEDAAFDGQYLDKIYQAECLLRECLDDYCAPETVIRKCRETLTKAIVPDSEQTADQTISALLDILDGPMARSAMHENFKA